ncbi:MAG: TadE-like protein [Solirubrobacterales bacterium]|jgi:Flp pilus assembly protein TadG|nr:TadE-like protein [Solirubrobacterales bacterium]
MHFSAITSRLREEAGQSAVEFALVLPLFIAFVFLIVEFSRTFNAYNDVNQMAANGVRLAAVNRYPGAASLIASEADTGAVQNNATVALSYPNTTCNQGDPVRVTVTTPITILSLKPYLDVQPLTLTGHAEMRIEVPPTAGC